MPALRPELDSLEHRELPAAPFQILPAYPFADTASYDHVRAISVEARLAGRNPASVLKIGDSNSEGFGEDAFLKPLASISPSAIAGFGPSIVDTWATFRGSFANVTGAARSGFTTVDVISGLPGAIAATNPGTALIMIGTNDAYRATPPNEFNYRLEFIVNQLLDAKVVPILSTLPEDLAFGDGVANLARAYNQVIANLAETYRIPLWNAYRQLASIPSFGLTSDRLHLNTSPNGGGSFSPVDLQFGQNLRNLGALTMLDWYRNAINAVPTEQAMPVWTSLAGRTVYAAALDLGQAPVVSIHDATTNEEVNRFYAFEPGFVGGVRVATGDVNGDTIPDIVVGAGPTGGPAVAVFSGADGSRLATFFAYEGSFRGGVGSVAVRDLDGDGMAEIAVGAGNGGGPAIVIYRGGTFEEAARFFAYDGSFRGGVNVALGEFEGIGPAIVAGAGVGGGPHVKLFAWDSLDSIRSFMVDDSAFRGGVAVAAGDFDDDGRDELATGRAAGGSNVAISDPGTQAILRRLPLTGGSPRAGVRLGAVPNGVGDDLLVANGPGGTRRLDRYPSLDADALAIVAADALRSFGIQLG
jgi:lysophospholipase L1-like esterase